MQNANDLQKQAIIDIINLLKKSFDIKDNDETVISQNLSTKQHETEQKIRDLQQKENEFRKSTALEIQQIRQHRNEIRKQQLDIRNQFNDLNQKINALQSQEQSNTRQLEEIKKKNQLLIEKEQSLNEQLQRMAEMSKEDIIKLLCSKFEDEARLRANKILKDIVNEASLNAQNEAKNILAFAVQKESINIVTNFATCVIDLPNESLKGKIIGREGRNIRAFEELTGVSVLVDDTPEAIVISCYEPMRREIARIAMTKLIADGRIHPQRIEEVVQLATKEITDDIDNTARDVLSKFQVINVHNEIATLLGKLKYRTSYSQNVLEHSCEVAAIAGDIAAELKFDKVLAFRAGLLHDIGKALDRLVSGSHAEIGANFARKCNESELICKIIAEHHDDEPTTIYTWIIKTADMLSSARPGVRQDSFDNYVKRLTDLEKIASTIDGVKSAFAMSAGRELRVAVESEKISDVDVNTIAEDIKSQIEHNINYPGQIKVTVIRETRCIKMAS